MHSRNNTPAPVLLNLERGCVEHDPATNLWLVRGHHWKGAVDDDGEKLPDGAERHDPWTVVQPVAQAVDVLQRLHPHPMLFPSQLQAHGKYGGRQRRTAHWRTGMTAHSIVLAVADLVTWINRHCQQNDHDEERVPADPRGPITLSRFRRTLAWHIVRKPRGLVAGAIQYGHLHTRITLGYSGSHHSGFPDDHAYEDWLFRLEQYAEHNERLASGEHVSGPASDTYRHRVHTATTTFAGRVLTTGRQARDLLDNPLLQIFPGRAMTCVFDPAKALCQLLDAGGEAGTRCTPDQSDCRPTCKNLAYTDQNITDLNTQARRLREIVTDPLAPSIRRARDKHELDRITTIINRHQRGN